MEKIDTIMVFPDGLLRFRSNGEWFYKKLNLEEACRMARDVTKASVNLVKESKDGES